MGLETYQKKRDFRRTTEPRGKVSKKNLHRFVVQEHHASMLHFDFRLEMGGVLKSWSVRKGPSLDPTDKRLAVQTEDHPVEYLKFEGHIPEGNYGAGEHMIWDEGKYELVGGGDDPLKQYEAGKLKIRLHGKKLRGDFNLFRLGNRENQWLLVKSKDEFAEEGWRLELRMRDERWETETSKRRADGPGSGSGKAGVRKIRTSKRAAQKAIPASRAFKAEELSGDLNVKVGRDVVSLTNLDKVYWPGEGYTKADLIKYYFEVAKYILPYLKDRPLIMKRYPNGIAGSFFHQHDVNEAPEYVHTETLEAEGHTVDYIIGDNLATLLHMANLGAIERHPWHSRVARLERPDWLVFDLDPQGVEWSAICKLALSVKEILERLGLESYAKTSGSRGIHVYVPIKPKYSYAAVADFAERVAVMVEDENPAVATTERSLKKRKRARIYVDHMQNARGKSVVAPYSVRPKPGATVSAPLAWSEVKNGNVTIQDFTIRTMMERLKRKGDLFKPVLNNRQGLERAIRRLDELTSQPKTKRAGA